MTVEEVAGAPADVAGRVDPAAPGRFPVRVPVVAAIVVLQGLGLWWATRLTGYAGDDYLNLLEARMAGHYSWTFARQSIFGHFAPGHHTVFYLLYRYAPLNYDVARVFMIVLSLLATICLWRTLRRLFGDSPGTRLLLAVFAWTALQLQTVFWFSAALHVLTSIAGALVAIDGITCWALSRRRWALVETTVGLGFGLAFYEKTVLAPVLAALLLVLVASPGRSRAAWRALLRCTWPAWVATLPAYVPWAAYYLSHRDWYYSPVPAPGVGLTVRTLAVSIFQGILPSMAGVAGQPGLPGLPWGVTAAIGDVLAIGVLVALVARSPLRARKGLLFGALGVLAEVGIVIWTRAAAEGSILGLQDRYLQEAGFVLTFAVALIAFAPTERALALVPAESRAAARQPALPPARSSSHRARPRVAGGTWWRAGVAVACVVLVVDVWTTQRLGSTYFPHVAAVQRTNFDADYARLTGEHVSFSVADRLVSDQIAVDRYLPFAAMSTNFDLDGTKRSWNDTRRPMLVMQPDGHLVAARLQSFGSDAATHCGGGTGVRLINFPVANPHPTDVTNVLVRLTSTVPVLVDLQAHDGDTAEFAQRGPTDQLFAGGTGSILISVTPERYSSLAVVLTPQRPGGRVCVTSMTAGLVVPDPGVSPEHARRF